MLSYMLIELELIRQTVKWCQFLLNFSPVKVVSFKSVALLISCDIKEFQRHVKGIYFVILILLLQEAIKEIKKKNYKKN